MRIALSGSSGLVGAQLQPLLESSGHKVVPMVRKASGDSGQFIQWDTESGLRNPEQLRNIDAIVHLAGEGIASGRWTEEKKQRILRSRVDGTTRICQAMTAVSDGPKTLVCASAIGYYGSRGDAMLDETSTPGRGFLADVVQQWEAATRIASDAGIRVVNTRFGIVLSAKGGALAKMLTPFKWGAGGRVGSGGQYWSWIALDDAIGAIQHALTTESLSGPVNVVAPEPITNLKFTKVLGSVLRRPTVFPLPAFAARLVLGEMADELLLSSTRVIPTKLRGAGYQFQFTDLAVALRHVLKG